MTQQSITRAEGYGKWADMFRALVEQRERIDEIRELLDAKELNFSVSAGQLTDLFKATLAPLVEWEIASDCIRFYFLPPLITSDKTYPAAGSLDYSVFQDGLASKLLTLHFCTKAISSFEYQSMFIYFDAKKLADYAKDRTKTEKIEMWKDDAWVHIKEMIIKFGYMEPVIAEFGVEK